jgi:tetratricopeptide (TPR) repeat protein
LNCACCKEFEGSRKAAWIGKVSVWLEKLIEDRAFEKALEAAHDMQNPEHWYRRVQALVGLGRGMEAARVFHDYRAEAPPERLNDLRWSILDLLNLQKSVWRPRRWGPISRPAFLRAKLRAAVDCKDAKACEDAVKLLETNDLLDLEVRCLSVAATACGGRLAEGHEELERFTRTVPDSPLPWLGMSLISSWQGHDARAISEAGQAIALAPHCFAGHARLIHLHYLAPDAPAAYAAVEAGLKMLPDHVQLEAWAIQFLLKLGRLADASPRVTDIMRREPASVNALVAALKYHFARRRPHAGFGETRRFLKGQSQVMSWLA